MWESMVTERFQINPKRHGHESYACTSNAQRPPLREVDIMVLPKVVEQHRPDPRKNRPSGGSDSAREIVVPRGPDVEDVAVLRHAAEEKRRSVAPGAHLRDLEIHFSSIAVVPQASTRNGPPTPELRSPAKEGFYFSKSGKQRKLKTEKKQQGICLSTVELSSDEAENDDNDITVVREVREIEVLSSAAPSTSRTPRARTPPLAISKKPASSSAPHSSRLSNPPQPVLTPPPLPQIRTNLMKVSKTKNPLDTWTTLDNTQGMFMPRSQPRNRVVRTQVRVPPDENRAKILKTQWLEKKKAAEEQRSAEAAENAKKAESMKAAENVKKAESSKAAENVKKAESSKAAETRKVYGSSRVHEPHRPRESSLVHDYPSAPNSSKGHESHQASESRRAYEPPRTHGPSMDHRFPKTAEPPKAQGLPKSVLRTARSSSTVRKSVEFNCDFNQTHYFEPDVVEIEEEEDVYEEEQMEEEEFQKIPITGGLQGFSGNDNLLELSDDSNAEREHKKKSIEKKSKRKEKKKDEEKLQFSKATDWGGGNLYSDEEDLLEAPKKHRSNASSPVYEEERRFKSSKRQHSSSKDVAKKKKKHKELDSIFGLEDSDEDIVPKKKKKSTRIPSSDEEWESEPEGAPETEAEVSSIPLVNLADDDPMEAIEDEDNDVIEIIEVVNTNSSSGDQSDIFDPIIAEFHQLAASRFDGVHLSESDQAKLQKEMDDLFKE